MKQKWLELTWPQRVMILIQAFLILLFLILYCTVGCQQVVKYRDAYLRRRADGEITTYSGKLDGQKAVFTVSPGPVVEFSLGDTRYGPYTIVFDPTAVPGEEALRQISAHSLVGVEVWEGETRLFRGSYQSAGSPFCLVHTDGELSYGDERVLTEVETGYGTTTTYAPSKIPGPYTILKLALAPEVARRGVFGFFLLGALFCVFNAGFILYADALFRWNLRFRVRYPEDAEPSEWELFSRWIGWIAVTVAALVFFILGLNFG